MGETAKAGDGNQVVKWLLVVIGAALLAWAFVFVF